MSTNPFILLKFAVFLINCLKVALIIVFDAVVGSLFGNVDIVRMALLQGCSGDLHKSALFL
jgi:hypothetical protein